MEEVEENRFDCKIYVLLLPYEFGFERLYIWIRTLNIAKPFQTNNSYSLVNQKNSYLFCIYTTVQEQARSEKYPEGRRQSFQMGHKFPCV